MTDNADIPRPLMLYDGECGLCDKSMRFVLNHDKQGQFHFMPLQSDGGRQILEANGYAADYRDSILLVDRDGTVSSHSTAALRIASRLDGLYKVLGWFRIIPRPIRDLGYRMVAAIRYKTFGKVDTNAACTLLPAEQRKRIHL